MPSLLHAVLNRVLSLLTHTCVLISAGVGLEMKLQPKSMQLNLHARNKLEGKSYRSRKVKRRLLSPQG